jgi:tetratricopeptide (TPR) repeat protein
MLFGAVRMRPFVIAALLVFLASGQTTDSALPLQVIVVRSLQEAQGIFDRAGKGADFSQLAQEQSIDPTSENRGIIGMLSPNLIRSELRDALKRIGPGQLTPVVSIPSGYAILRVMRNDEMAAAMRAEPSRSLALTAAGSVRYVQDVDGLTEAQVALARFRKPAGWNREPRSICEYRNQSLAAAMAALQRELTVTGPARHPIDIMEAHFALGQLYAFQGEMTLAIAQYQSSYDIAQSSVPESIPQMEETLGVAYLHRAEMENSVYRKPGLRDLFPMRPESSFTNTTDSKRALQYFLRFLARKPDDLEVTWLLNITCMTLGRCPAEVPAKFVIPRSVFDSKEDVGRFIDVADDTGLKSFSSAGGVVAEDFENNGLLDVVTSAFESCGPMRYFHNNGDGSFTDQTERSGLGTQIGGLNMIQADYNNDGCTDILVLRGAWEFPQRMSLLRNNCNGTFTDVTVESGLAKELTTSQAAVWADINNDGLLDLFIGNENSRALLYLNKGDGTFEDISLLSGVDGDGSAFIKAVAAADYDNDGRIDLYASNLNGTNFLFHNNGDNTFTDVTAKAHVPGSGKGFATWFFDYDNDGLPDLFTTSYFVSVEETARTYLGLRHNARTLNLYKNLGDGTFRDVTKETGLDKVFMPMGANFGDVDNDGYLDIYLGTGNPSYASLVPNVLLRNHDGKYFVDITTASGTGQLHKGHAVAFADLGNNGNEDIIAEIGGATPGDRHTLRLFKNPGHPNDWITLKLTGVKTNRSAIGARVKVTAENNGVSRAMWRTVGSGGSFGASPLQQHIGLGPDARISSIEVYWPVSKSRQVFTGVAKNQFLGIKELEKEYTRLERKTFELGAKR